MKSNNKKPLVILAEDEKDLREIYTMALTAKGFEIIPVEDGKQLYEELSKRYEEVDIILLDVVMPHLDGFEALKKIKADKKYEHIPVIMSTNLSQYKDKQEAFSLGADEYFIKSEKTPQQLAGDAWNIYESKK